MEDASKTKLERVVSTDEMKTMPTASVVRIDFVKSPKNPLKPWVTGSGKTQGSGSGFAVQFSQRGSELKRGILTNAHVVFEATVLRLRKTGAPGTFPARVISLAVDIDLALLVVDDDKFWETVGENGKITPLTVRAALPPLYSDVLCIGYPTGGMAVCVTKGVVSRLTTTHYAIDENAAAPSLLAIQIDAAINPGNSGGPVVDTDFNLIGVAAQKVGDKPEKKVSLDNIGFIIPTTTVNNFLLDIAEHGEYRGVAYADIRIRPLQNPSLKIWHGVEPTDQTGVLVGPVASWSASTGLKEGDVLLEIDGHQVADDGTIAVGDGVQSQRLEATYALTQHRVGDEVGEISIFDSKWQI